MGGGGVRLKGLGITAVHFWKCAVIKQISGIISSVFDAHSWNCRWSHQKHLPAAKNLQKYLCVNWHKCKIVYIVFHVTNISEQCYFCGKYLLYGEHVLEHL
jgi:ribosomal protein S27E